MPLDCNARLQVNELPEAFFAHCVCEYYRSGVLLLGVKIYQTLCCSLETTLRSPPPLAARSLVAHSPLH